MLIFDSSKQKQFYRVEGGSDGYATLIQVRHFVGVKQTQRGWWVLSQDDLYFLRGVERANANKPMTEKEQFAQLKKSAGSRLRFVLDNDRSRLCRADFKSALSSFRARKRRQIDICTHQLQSAQHQLEGAISLTDEDIDRLKLTGHIRVTTQKMWEPNFDLEDDE